MAHPVCPFCNRADYRSSKEHVLADWIGREFPRGVWTTTQLESPLLGAGPPKLLRQFKSKKPKMVTNRPCERCNNTWMAKLEARARPLLASMMRGCTITLDPAQRQLLVRWLLKTAMNLELTHGKKHETFFSQTERHALMRSSSIPYSALVFLGRYRGTMPLQAREMQLPLEAPYLDRLVPVKGYTVTLSIAALVIQLLCVRLPHELDPDALAIEYNQADAAITIWPAAEDVTWPPARHLDNGTFDGFAMPWTTARFFVRV